MLLWIYIWWFIIGLKHVGTVMISSNGLLGSLTCVSCALGVWMNEVLHSSCKLSGKITSVAAKIVAAKVVSSNVKVFLHICWTMHTKWFMCA